MDAKTPNHYQLLDALRSEQQRLIDSLRFDKVKEVMRKHLVLAADDSRYTQQQLSHILALLPLIPADKIPPSIRTEDIVYYVEHLRNMLQEMENLLEA